MLTRGRLAVLAAVAVGLVVLPLSRLFGPDAALPTLAAWCLLAAMACLLPEQRRRLGWWAGVPGAVSLATTAWVLARDHVGSIQQANWALLEMAGLLLLLIHAVRWNRGPSLWLVPALLSSAAILWLLRYMPERSSWTSAALGCAFWSLWSGVAVVFGAYPRWAAARERRSVAAAREAQQRQLERDLHDYVAHDLSGMIVQAQAARYAAADDPERLAAALARIEEAGQRAMSSMDRALSLLRDARADDEPDTVAHPGLEALPGLVARFGEDGSRSGDLRVAGDVASVPREVSEALYRACVEGLTNVRRHGPPDANAGIHVTVGDDRAALEVCSPVAGIPSSPRTGGGTGLEHLRARVEALRGSVQAGPEGSAWRLVVTIPFGGSAPQVP